MGLPAAPGAHTMIFAICDANNGLLDTGLMVKAGGCVDCDKGIKINYATTTTTVGPTPFVRTIQASGTISGTVVYGVPEDATANTEEVATSTEVTATTTEAITSSEDSTTATTDVAVATTTSEDSTLVTGTTTASDPSTPTTSTQGGFTTIRRGCRP
ncbi:hypothetical protein BFJ63_vAg7691 [Fusarium oxysporum f. sp. narcissi]|uniref:Uncharacterized protein n=1 Tax=Fusarium oxysporum f. sp. narcissi TaxID=451672 RepID=A0A4Q2VT99_FUSOX|nr:hypothetical protein BFJ63_vAg7691 [Fusarium oxysporum f. sp. narcissi]